MLTVLHIKVIIQLKTVKSRPMLMSNIHKHNIKMLHGLLKRKHNSLTYHKRILVSSWSKIHLAGRELKLKILISRMMNIEKIS